MQTERFYQLRKKFGLSQETMAELFSVSRQSIQKWESGKAVPDIERLIAIADYFHVSTDFLLRKEDTRSIDQMRIEKDILPHYQSMHTWDLYSSALMIEYAQCIDEGKEIASYKNLFQEIAVLPASKHKEDLADVLFHLLQESPTSQTHLYHEPSDLSEIKNARKKSVLSLPKAGEQKHKIHGAWVGRICGCLLGKTVEGISCEELTTLLKATDNFPMNRYIMKKEIPEHITKELVFDLKSRRCFADEISCAPSDDDTNYTVLAMQLIEKYGKAFTPEHVASIWVELQGKNAYCTAERVAYLNFMNGFAPPASAVYKNPYREWIGAQIRGDYFGYLCPGNPEMAAELAWRDASISHVKNGIYGEMFVAAMLACAAVISDIKQIVLCGIGEIPQHSRLYERIATLVEQYESGVAKDDWFRAFHTRYNDRIGHDWCHTISNAELVAASLLYGEGDYTKSICLAVQNGFDTDCNGATVGSVIGMRNGIDGIDATWQAPIHNTLDTTIFGVGKVNILDLVEKTLQQIAT